MSLVRPALPGRRPWTRLGLVATATHGFYELASGVSIPSASVVGPIPAVAGWATGSVWAFQAAGRANPLHNFTFGALNGMSLAAVLAHFIFWPKRWVGCFPWLTECEGLRGQVITPYNTILYVSAFAGLAGVAENGRAGMRGALVPVLFVPVLLRLQSVEFRRLRAQARRRPGWWNRRLQEG